MKLQIQQLHPKATLPTRATATAAGLDLYSVDGGNLSPGSSWLHDTGIAVQLPPGHVGLVCPRSGLANRHGITVLNAPGVIDEDFRGAVGVILVNLGRESYTINPGDRIAQLLVVPIAMIEVDVVDKLGGTDRGAGGFGSSGR
jgi:dUTP pyrophosphatase